MSATPRRLYPLRFAPISQETEWHGSLLSAFRREVDSGPAPAGCGVSWELVDSPEVSSQVANGPLAGKTLTELVAEFPNALVGVRQRPGMPFPVYLRLLDVGRDLPLLVHADEALCRATAGLQTNTKFWYCLEARAQAELMVGIGRRVTASQLLESLNSLLLRDHLQTFAACPGDSYLIPAGRVHSASASVLVWELGQHPASALCVSGWTEAEATDPVARDLAVRAVHFEDRQVSRICREMGVSAQTRKIPLMNHCPYFVVEEVRLVDHWFDRTNGASFHLLNVIRGSVELQTDVGNDRLESGSVRLIPAEFGGYRCAAVGGPAALLRVRLQSLR